MTKKTIDTLIPDIEEALMNGVEVSDKLAKEFGLAVGKMIQSRLSPEGKNRGTNLRMSNIGNPCGKKLWGQINLPEEEKEKMRPEAYLKFLYGDLIEELMLFLAGVTGHKVNGRQGHQEIAGVIGHRDAIIDGVLIDVKSAAPFSYTKFSEEGGLHPHQPWIERGDPTWVDRDPFGYRTQLQSYLYASQDDKELVVKDKAAFWAVDKVGGHQCLSFYDKVEYDAPLEDKFEERKEMVNSETPPERGYEPEPDGYKKKEKDGTYTFRPNGNLKLPMFCSYCDVKFWCHKGLRKFVHSRGPVYMTHVEKEPSLFEVDMHDNPVEK